MASLPADRAQRAAAAQQSAARRTEAYRKLGKLGAERDRLLAQLDKNEIETVRVVRRYRDDIKTVEAAAATRRGRTTIHRWMYRHSGAV